MLLVLRRTTEEEKNYSAGKIGRQNEQVFLLRNVLGEIKIIKGKRK